MADYKTQENDLSRSSSYVESEDLEDIPIISDFKFRNQVQGSYGSRKSFQPDNDVKRAPQNFQLQLKLANNIENDIEKPIDIRQKTSSRTQSARNTKSPRTGQLSQRSFSQQLSQKPSLSNVRSSLDNSDTLSPPGSIKSFRGKYQGLQVDLMSTALKIPKQNLNSLTNAVNDKNCKGSNKSIQAAVQQSIVESLGIDFNCLQIYEVKPISIEDITKDTEHIATQVFQSDFTLSSLEDLIRDNKRLQSAKSSAYKEHEDEKQARVQAQASLAQLELQLAEKDADFQRVLDILKIKQEENQFLRQQLRKSDQARVSNMKIVDQLTQQMNNILSKIQPSHYNGQKGSNKKQLNYFQRNQQGAVQGQFSSQDIQSILGQEQGNNQRLAQLLRRLNNKEALQLVEKTLDNIENDSIAKE